MQIAIDGPAGAGKSTIAKMVSKKMNMMYLDTGAMYRAVGLKAVRQQVDTQDQTAVEALVPDISIDIQYQDGTQMIYLDGEDVTGMIRTPDVSMAASNVSKWPAVRRKLVELQQDIAGRNDVVMDGRDIGTHVLPGAEFKFYITASVEERARRRHLELEGKGVASDLHALEKEIAARDEQDMNRVFAPLRVADGAQVVDTTNMTANEVIDHVFSIIRKELS